MKVFTKENGKDVVYVQRKDLNYLFNNYTRIPSEIFHEAFGAGEVIIGGGNKEQYVKLAEKKAVNYLRNSAFIIDYDDCKNLSSAEIAEWYNIIVNQMNERIAKRYKSYTKNDLDFSRNGNYILEAIRDFGLAKQRGEVRLPEGYIENKETDKHKTLTLVPIYAGK